MRTAPQFTTNHIREALQRVESTGTIDRKDAEILLHARGDELNDLLRLAGRLRDEGLTEAGRPGIITYSKKVFLPLTKLCRDRCHYCVFVETPGQLAFKGEPVFMEAEDLLDVAQRGARLGCKEALFTLGDRPEERWPEAREWLAQRGYQSTLDYVKAMAVLILEETGLLPHLNPGVMTWAEMQKLRPVAPSMGMMLETTSVRLWSEKGQPHYGSPDKEPKLRLRVLDDAGRSRIPFTTGLLLGIGESYVERVDALFEIRRAHERYGHIQEIIVQNFRAKDRTAMRDKPDFALHEYAAVVAVARLVMGPEAVIQAPPNLTDEAELALLVKAGVSDWGGVSPLTPDHVNPERPWPNLTALSRLTRETGYELRERLTAHPKFVADQTAWIDTRLHAHVKALADPPSRLANEQAPVLGLPWRSEAPKTGHLTPDISSILRRATQNPSGLSDADYVRLLATERSDLEALCQVADDVRKQNVGNDVTYVINRNIDASMFRSQPKGPTASGPAREDLPEANHISTPILTGLLDEAVLLGATEVCVQGAVHNAADYLKLISSIRSCQPHMHIHAYRPSEIMDGAARLGISVIDFLKQLKSRGLNSVPGTGAKILNDRIRATLSDKTDPPVSDWIGVITAAHMIGLKSTATMVYGHIESPAEQVEHLRTLATIQDRTGGFTEFIAMPYLHAETPIQLPNAARRRPAVPETRALHAVARLLLDGRIDNHQTAWTKHGFALSQQLLQGGANDFGGLLLDGRLNPEAGPEAHRTVSPPDVAQLCSEIGRATRQRTTNYGPISEQHTLSDPSAPGSSHGHN